MNRRAAPAPQSAAVRNLTERPDSVVIGGTTIHVDKETSRELIRLLRISEGDNGVFTAQMRHKPLSTDRGHPSINVSPVSDVPHIEPNKPANAVASRIEARTRCDICAEPERGKRLAVDHDHATGALRGFLCNKCNVGLGMFRDSPQLMGRASAYVQNPPGVFIERYRRRATAPV